MFLGLGDENIFAKQRVITIPAGHALIHDPRLVYVPLANLFNAMNRTHLWACTFHLSETPATADASGDEDEAAAATGAPAAKKAKAAASEPKASSVYFGASRLPAGSVETRSIGNPTIHTFHHSEIAQLEEYIKKLTAELDEEGASPSTKQIIASQITRLHHMLAEARATLPPEPLVGHAGSEAMTSRDGD